MWIEALDVDEHVLDKIESKHGVEFDEVVDVCFSPSHHARRSRQGLYKVFGQTDAGRYLLVVLAQSIGHDWKVVAAREMTLQEQRLYRRQRGE